MTYAVRHAGAGDAVHVLRLIDRAPQLQVDKRHADDGAFAFYRSLGFDAEAKGSACTSS